MIFATKRLLASRSGADNAITLPMTGLDAKKVITRVRNPPSPWFCLGIQTNVKKASNRSIEGLDPGEIGFFFRKFMLGCTLA
jgi:hypothetical protein